MPIKDLKKRKAIVKIVKKGWHIKEELKNIRKELEPLEYSTVMKVVDDMIHKANQIFPG